MKKKSSKKEVNEELEFFFKNIKIKSPKEIKKIKKLSMKYNLPLKEKRKLFCKKCYAPYVVSNIRIKKRIKQMRCEKCGYVSRWKLK